MRKRILQKILRIGVCGKNDKNTQHFPEIANKYGYSKHFFKIRLPRYNKKNKIFTYKLNRRKNG